MFVISTYLVLCSEDCKRLISWAISKPYVGTCDNNTFIRETRDRQRDRNKDEIWQPTPICFNCFINTFMSTFKIAGERQLPCLIPLNTANLAGSLLYQLLDSTSTVITGMGLSRRAALLRSTTVFWSKLYHEWLLMGGLVGRLIFGQFSSEIINHSCSGNCKVLCFIKSRNNHGTLHHHGVYSNNSVTHLAAVLRILILLRYIDAFHITVSQKKTWCWTFCNNFIC